MKRREFFGLAAAMPAAAALPAVAMPAPAALPLNLSSVKSRTIKSWEIVYKAPIRSRTT